ARAAKAKAADKAKPKDTAKDVKSTAGTEGSSITAKIRSLLVGASVVVIVLGTFKMAMNLLDTSTAPPMPALEEPAQPPVERGAAPAQPASPAPSMISPAPLGRQSNNSAAPNMLDAAPVGGQFATQQPAVP